MINEIFKAACVQNCAGTDMEANLADTEALVRYAASQGASLICLPEFFSCLELRDGTFEIGDRIEDEHPGLPVVQRLAEELRVWVQMGSLAIRSPTGKIHNRAYTIGSIRRPKCS